MLEILSNLKPFLHTGVILLYSDNKFSKNRYSIVDNISARFHAIFLIDSKTGLTFLSKKFSKNLNKFNSDNEDLISGFLNALNYFVKELDFENESIEEVNFKNNRILYEQKGRLMAIAISKKTDIGIERRFLSMIINDFYLSFKVYIENFCGDVRIFEKFKDKLDLYKIPSVIQPKHSKIISG